MSNMTTSRIGQVNGAGATDAIFLKVFAGEVLAAFNAENKLMDKHMVRSIASGKSAQFPVIGKTTASYHTVGNEILGTAIKHNERVVTIDGILEADVFIADIDEAMNHYDVRGEYARQLGEALALKNDQQQLQMGLLAARAAATITGGDGGTVLTNAAFSTDGAAIGTGLFDAGTALDQKNVSSSDRWAFLRPAQYALLAQQEKYINKFYDARGSIATGIIPLVNNINVVKTNNLPSTNIASGLSKYQGNFSTTYGLVMHKSAIGTVKLLDMKVQKDYLLQNLGTLVVASQALGTDILRPESAVEMKTS